MSDGPKGQDRASQEDEARTNASRRENSGLDSQEKPAAQDGEPGEGKPDSATVHPKAEREY